MVAGANVQLLLQLQTAAEAAARALTELSRIAGQLANCHNGVVGDSLFGKTNLNSGIHTASAAAVAIVNPLLETLQDTAVGYGREELQQNGAANWIPACQAPAPAQIQIPATTPQHLETDQGTYLSSIDLKPQHQHTKPDFQNTQVRATSKCNTTDTGEHAASVNTGNTVPVEWGGSRTVETLLHDTDLVSREERKQNARASASNAGATKKPIPFLPDPEEGMLSQKVDLELTPQTNRPGGFVRSERSSVRAMQLRFDQISAKEAVPAPPKTQSKRTRRRQIRAGSPVELPVSSVSPQIHAPVIGEYTPHGAAATAHSMTESTTADIATLSPHLLISTWEARAQHHQEDSRSHHVSSTASQYTARAAPSVPPVSETVVSEGAELHPQVHQQDVEVEASDSDSDGDDCPICFSTSSEQRATNCACDVPPCTSCRAHQAQVQAAENIPWPLCPGTCAKPMNYRDLRQLPLGEATRHELEKLQRMEHNKFRNESAGPTLFAQGYAPISKSIWCSNPVCDNLLDVNGTEAICYETYCGQHTCTTHELPMTRPGPGLTRTCAMCVREATMSAEDLAKELTAAVGSMEGKKCPQCHVVMYKDGGCCHMTCPPKAGGCGYEFLWCCGRAYRSRPATREHYADQEIFGTPCHRYYNPAMYS